MYVMLLEVLVIKCVGCIYIAVHTYLSMTVETKFKVCRNSVHMIVCK